MGSASRVVLGSSATDVLVAGASVAGCTLAYLLRQHGYNVTLVERQRVANKDKLCGGVVLAEGQRLMDKIFGSSALDGLDAIHLEGMHILYRAYESTLTMDSFRALPRAKLDAYLLEQAVAAGTKLVERTSVIGVDETARSVTLRDLTTGEISQMSYGTLVAADGAFSRVRRLVTRRRPQTVVSFEATTTSPVNCKQIVQRVYPAIAGGCWLIPQGPSAIIGCLFFPDASREPIGDQRARLRAFAEELGCPMGKLRGALIPTGNDILLRTPKNTCFIGDAAGLVKPALGAGIHLALQSALALSQDLAGSARYEDAMAPVVDHLQEGAKHVINAYINLGVHALVKHGL